MDTFLLESYLELDNFIIPILVKMFSKSFENSKYYFWLECPHCVLLNLIMQEMFAQQDTIVSKFQSISFIIANMKSIAYDTQFQNKYA
jgi:hypothetical protein